MAETKTVTCTAPVNIAVIKYWGKKDEKLIIPINDSISATLSSDQMHAKTTVSASPSYKSDRIWLNGKEESIENPRLVNCLREVRERARKGGKDSADILNWNVHICSENNFPTAAGLASSAAGYACLVYALCHLYGVESSTDMSTLARLGSGSACRSVLGGFVRWHSGGNVPDGSDSVARQLAAANHWSQMRVLICVAEDARKKVPSSKGMKRSVETSQLINLRASTCVPERVKQMEEAIKECDFQSFAELTMKDSNQFHAICLDTFPPCTYMNGTSHAIVDLIHQVNDLMGKHMACYTFDAGPNACIFLPAENVPLFKKLIAHFFSPANVDQELVRGEMEEDKNSEETEKKFQSLLPSIDLPILKGALKYVISTRVGDGPKTLEEEHHLLNEDGMPKTS